MKGGNRGVVDNNIMFLRQIRNYVQNSVIVEAWLHIGHFCGTVISHPGQLNLAILCGYRRDNAEKYHWTLGVNGQTVQCYWSSPVSVCVCVWLCAIKQRLFVGIFTRSWTDAYLLWFNHGFVTLCIDILRTFSCIIRVFYFCCIAFYCSSVCDWHAI